MTNPTGEQTITKEILNRYVEAGLTLTQMSERFQEEYGVARARTSFSAAMNRFGIRSAHPKTRHRQTLPWRVRQEHSMAYEARVLRWLGRRQAGLGLAPDEEQRLDAFLRELESDDKVVHYDPQTREGFWFVAREDGDDGYIRRPRE